MFGLSSPLLWVAVAGWLATFGTFGVMKVKELANWKAAYEQGESAGKSQASAAAVEQANKTAQARREAEAETPPLLTKAEIEAACKAEASCLERAKLKGAKR